MIKFDTEDQLIISTFSPGFGGTSVPEWIKPWLENGLGSVTLFGSNTPNLESTLKLVAELRSFNPNLVIAIDEEGGDVTRLFAHEGSPYPSPALLGRCDDETLTFAFYHSLGKLLKELGIDLTFAPVADVVTFYDNPIVGVRAFGSSPSLVSRHVSQAVQGIQSAGVGACLKHFPGHGPLLEDSHHTLPRVTLALDEYEVGHIEPFANGIAAGAAAVMVGHLIVEALDLNNPASLSPDIIRGYLRGEMKYQGLVVTDALDMGALGGIPSIDQSALNALRAGANLLCFSGLADQSEFIARSLIHVKSGLINGDIDRGHFENSSERISDFKKDFSLTQGFEAPIEPASLAKGFHISGSIYLESHDVCVLEVTTTPTIAAGNVEWGIAQFLRRLGVVCEMQTFDSAKAEHDGKKMVIAFKDAFRDPLLLDALRALETSHPGAIFIDMGWPTLEFSPRNIVRTFGSSSISSEVVAQLLTSQLSSTQLLSREER